MSKILLKGARLLDANWNGQTADVLTEDGRITQIGGCLERKDAEIIDLTDYTLMPGLVNAHTHIQCASDYTDEGFQHMAEAGVCLCHDLGFLVNTPMSEMIAWAKKTNQDASFPLLDYAGRYIAVPGGYGDTIPGGFQVGELVQTQEDCIKAVDFMSGFGCHGIKIGMDYGHGKEEQPQLPDDLIAAICQRAKEHGLWISCHVHEERYLEHLEAGGITQMAHVVKQPIPAPLMKQMIDNGVDLVATLTNFYRHPDRYDQTVLDTVVDNTRRFHELGGVVSIGTDFMWPFEKWLTPVEEMRLFRLTGMSTREILICATLNGAKACRMEADFGTIERGKYACLIAVYGELDEDFTKLEQPAFVMNRGKVLHWA